MQYTVTTMIINISTRQLVEIEVPMATAGVLFDLVKLLSDASVSISGNTSRITTERPVENPQKVAFGAMTHHIYSYKLRY